MARQLCHPTLLCKVVAVGGSEWKLCSAECSSVNGKWMLQTCKEEYINGGLKRM